MGYVAPVLTVVYTSACQEAKGRSWTDILGIRMENKYNKGDVLSFVIQNEPKRGIVWIVDGNGTFGQHEYPSYDIYVAGEDMLYKHVIEPEVTLVRRCPIVDGRLVSDKTFARRLCGFLKGIKATDLPSMEELGYLTKVAGELLAYQVETVVDSEEYGYLDRLGLLDDVHRRRRFDLHYD